MQTGMIVKSTSYAPFVVQGTFQKYCASDIPKSRSVLWSRPRTGLTEASPLVSLSRFAGHVAFEHTFVG
jgi:hypothetical protein